MKLLLVEDDNDMSRALSRALAHRGFVVTPCFDGVEALRLLREQTHDGVLLDLSIPGIDGLHVLQRMRAAGDTTLVPVSYTHLDVYKRQGCGRRFRRPFLSGRRNNPALFLRRVALA